MKNVEEGFKSTPNWKKAPKRSEIKLRSNIGVWSSREVLGTEEKCIKRRLFQFLAKLKKSKLENKLVEKRFSLDLNTSRSRHSNLVERENNINEVVEITELDEREEREHLTGRWTFNFLLNIFFIFQDKGIRYRSILY